MKIHTLSALLLGALCVFMPLAPTFADPNEAGLAPVPGDQVPPANASLLLPGANPTGYVRVPVQAKQTEAVASGTGKKYYVAPTETTGESGSPKVANDAAANSRANPWSLRKTIAAVNADPGGAGSVVVFYGGTYRGVGDRYKDTPDPYFALDTTNDFTFTRPVTLQNVPGQQPWLKGSALTDTSPGVWQPATEAGGVSLPPGTYKRAWSETAGKHLGFYDLQIDNGDKRDKSKNPASGVADMVFVDGKMLRPVVAFSWDYKEKVKDVEEKRSGSKTAQEQLLPPDDKRSPNGTFWLDSANNTLYVNLGADPTGKTVEINTRLAQGIKIASVASGSVVRGLGFAHYTEYGLFVYHANAFELSHCAFAWNGMIGAQLRGPRSTTTCSPATVKMAWP